MPATFELSLTVASDDVDGWGHANNLVYLHWLMRAATAHSAAQGWDAARYRESGGAFVVRSHRLEYRRPCFAGDALTVRTWVEEFAKASSRRWYRITRTNEVGAEETILEASTDWAYVSLDGGKPRRIPAELAASFEIVPERLWQAHRPGA